MEFEWDEDKNWLNIAKHKLDFAQAAEVFAGDHIESFDTRFDYAEDRLSLLGLLDGRCVQITYTHRDDRIRIISFRKASRYEQTRFFETYT